jgi:hypothetical protein
MSQPGTKDQWTYFGLWSAKDVQRVSQLLTSLDARFEIDEVQTDQGDLERWCAWDPTSRTMDYSWRYASMGRTFHRMAPAGSGSG